MPNPARLSRTSRGEGGRGPLPTDKVEHTRLLLESAPIPPEEESMNSRLRAVFELGEDVEVEEEDALLVSDAEGVGNEIAEELSFVMG